MVFLNYTVMVLMMGAALIACARIPSKAWSLRNALLVLIALGLTTELVAGLFRELGVRNSIVYNISFPLELMLILRLVHLFRRSWRNALLLAGALCTIIVVLSAVIYDPMEFVFVEAVVANSLVLCIILLASLWVLANTSDEGLHRVPEFWLFMGLLIYFGGMIPMIGLIRFVFDQDAALAARLYQIMPVLCMCRYAFTIYACVQVRRFGKGYHG